MGHEICSGCKPDRQVHCCAPHLEHALPFLPSWEEHGCHSNTAQLLINNCPAQLPSKEATTRELLCFRKHTYHVIVIYSQMWSGLNAYSRTLQAMCAPTSASECLHSSAPTNDAMAAGSTDQAATMLYRLPAPALQLCFSIHRTLPAQGLYLRACLLLRTGLLSPCNSSAWLVPPTTMALLPGLHC